MAEKIFDKIESGLIKAIFDILFEHSLINEEFEFSFKFSLINKIPRTSEVAIVIWKDSNIIDILEFFLILDDKILFTSSTIQEYIKNEIL